MKVIGFSLFVLVLFGCAFVGNPVESAREKVDAFHMNYNSGNFQEIEERASKEFTKITDLRKFRETLGTTVSSEKMRGSAASSGCSPATVTIIMRTNFVRGKAYEKFVFVQEIGDYVLIDYRHISEDEANGPLNGIV